MNPLDMDPEGSLVQVYLACCNNLAEVYHQLPADYMDKTNANNTSKEQAMKDWQFTMGQALWSIPPPSKASMAYAHFLNVSQVYGLRPPMMRASC